jgi:hypothetical protein
MVLVRLVSVVVVVEGSAWELVTELDWPPTPCKINPARPSEWCVEEACSLLTEVDFSGTEEVTAVLVVFR